MDYKHPNYLISTDELSAAIEANNENLRIFDVSITLVPNPPGYKAVSGLEDYKKGHIPGATFLDLARDFSDTTSGLGFTLPAADTLEQAFRQAGVSNDSQIVIYVTGHMMWATRAWWMLYSSGHKNVAVLNGGFAKWQQEGRAVSDQASATYPEGDFNINLNADRWADKAKVFAAISDDDICTINALSPGVYSGEADMSYGRKGHIENSKNVYYDEMLEQGSFKPADQIKEILETRGILDKPSVICYCGGGISATIDALALTLIGYENVAVYDGSMSEWVKDESLPLVLGNE